MIICSLHPIDGICETIPTFRSLSVLYDPLKISYAELSEKLCKAAAGVPAEQG